MSNYILKNQIIHVDSNNRLTGSHSNFTYQMDLSRNVEYDRVVVLDANIPKSYYLVQAGLNTFQLKESSATVTITLPAGNYNRTSLRNVLTTLLNTASPSGFNYTITNQNIQNTQDTGKYFYSVSGNGPIQPSFIFTTNLYEQLGFNANSTNNFSANQLVSTNITNLQPETRVFIRSDICQNFNDNILQNIDASQNADYSFIGYRNYCPREYSKEFRSGTTNVFFFQITDENGTILDTNGLNVVITIMIYQLNRIDELIKAYVHYKISKENDDEYLKQIEEENIEEPKLSDI
jgi:hypothetical protein